MPHYQYRAINTDGELQTGHLQAENRQQAISALSSRHLTPLTIRRARLTGWLRPKRSIPPLLLKHWCQQLATLLNAGLSLDQALDELQQESLTAHPLLAGLGTRLRQGQSLAEALNHQQALLGEHWTILLAAGEQSGQLVTTLLQLSQHLDWLQQEQQQTRQSLIQPLLSAGSVLAAICFMLIVLVPAIRPMLTGVAQPLPTKLLFSLVDGLDRYGKHLLILLMLLTGLWVFAHHRFPRCRYYTDRLRLHLPFFGGLHVRQELARYTHLWSLLYRNGIPILQALAVSRNCLTNLSLKKIFQHIEDSVSAGASPMTAFRASPFTWPSPILSMLQHGEKTGRLGDALEEMAVQLYQHHQQATQHLHRTLQPAILLLSGLTLGWIAAALLGPLYAQMGHAIF